jgi:DNA-directed RNA polymerase subunit K/omega
MSEKKGEDDKHDIEEILDYDEDEFIEKTQYKDFNPNIKFNVFDQENFIEETHKEIVIADASTRRTSEVMTYFEYTEVVSNRAKQIENGGKIYTDIGNLANPIEMAELEISMKKCPLSVMRMISSNIAEVWEVNEMVVPYN